MRKLLHILLFFSFLPPIYAQSILQGMMENNLIPQGGAYNADCWSGETIGSDCEWIDNSASLTAILSLNNPTQEEIEAVRILYGATKKCKEEATYHKEGKALEDCERTYLAIFGLGHCRWGETFQITNGEVIKSVDCVEGNRLIRQGKGGWRFYGKMNEEEFKKRREEEERYKREALKRQKALEDYQNLWKLYITKETGDGVWVEYYGSEKFFKNNEIGIGGAKIWEWIKIKEKEKFPDLFEEKPLDYQEVSKWTKKEQDIFINDCVDMATKLFMASSSKANEICDCALNNAIKNYDNLAEHREYETATMLKCFYSQESQEVSKWPKTEQDIFINDCVDMATKELVTSISEANSFLKKRIIKKKIDENKNEICDCALNDAMKNYDNLAEHKYETATMIKCFYEKLPN